MGVSAYANANADWLCHEQAPFGILRAQLDGRVVAVNQAMCVLVRATELDLVNTEVAELFERADRLAEGEERARLVRGEAAYLRVERQLIRKVGGPVWTRQTISLVKDESKSPAFVVYFIEETEAVGLQARTRLLYGQPHREEELARMAQHAPIGMFKADVLGTCICVNDAWSRLTGRTPSEAEGKAWFELVHEDDRPRAQRVWSDAVRVGAPFSIEHRLACKAGELWVLCHVTKSANAADGTPQFIGAITDITERILAERARAELTMTVRESEERFRRASEVARLLTYDIDIASGRVLVHGVEQLIGFAPPNDALAGGWWHARIHPEDLPGQLSVLAQHATAGGVRRLLYRVRHASGHWLNVEECREITLDESGQPRRILGTIVDQTARIRAELEARRREADSRATAAQLKTVTDHAPVFLLQCDARARVVFINTPCAARLGRSPAEVVGRPLHEVLGPKLYGLFRAHIEEALRGECAEIEEPVESRDGTLWIHATCVAQRGEDGTLKGFVAVLQDVTARKQAERELQERERRFRGIFDSAFQLIALLSRDGTVLEANRATLHASNGIEPPRSQAERQSIVFDVVGRPFWQNPWWFDEQAASVAESAVRRAAKGERVRFEVTLRALDGTSVTTDFALSPVIDESGGVALVVAEGRDVTARKQAADELTLALQQNETFVGVLSHDLRNPLSAVLTAAELGMSRPEGPIAKQAFERISRSGQRMLRMIEQLLDVTRIRGAGGLDIQCSPADLGAICKAAVEELEHSRPEVSIRSEQIGDAGGLWDPDRLAQLASNLLGNAVQHSSGERTVTVRIDGTDASNVRMTIHNHGAIAPELVPMLFEPFRRGATVTKKTTGLGLGLYITRQIALAHGGNLRVDSTPDRGTTFEVILPRHAIEVSPPPPTLRPGDSTLMRRSSSQL